ncbi:tryptorubin family RiPP precursor [Nocardia terpenica]
MRPRSGRELRNTLEPGGVVMALVRIVKRMKQGKSLKQYAWYGWI